MIRTKKRKWKRISISQPQTLRKSSLHLHLNGDTPSIRIKLINMTAEPRIKAAVKHRHRTIGAKEEAAEVATAEVKNEAIAIVISSRGEAIRIINLSTIPEGAESEGVVEAAARVHT